MFKLCPRIFTIFSFLRKQAQATHSNATEECISGMNKKNKTSSCRSLSLCGTLTSIMLVKTCINNPIQMETTMHTYWKRQKTSQLNIIDNILLSKYWVPFSFFCCIFKTKAVGCDNIQTTHSCQSVISTFLKSNFLLIVVFLGVSLLFWEVVLGIN